MEFVEGRIVISKAGRDAGTILAVAYVDEDSGDVFVCDGKRRSTENPKRKNPKHLAPTNTVLDMKAFISDSSLRRALKAFAEGADTEA